jgi:hypothetical protein
MVSVECEGKDFFYSGDGSEYAWNIPLKSEQIDLLDMLNLAQTSITIIARVVSDTRQRWAREALVVVRAHWGAAAPQLGPNEPSFSGWSSLGF